MDESVRHRGDDDVDAAVAPREVCAAAQAEHALSLLLDEVRLRRDPHSDRHGRQLLEPCEACRVREHRSPERLSALQAGPDSGSGDGSARGLAHPHVESPRRRERDRSRRRPLAHIEERSPAVAQVCERQHVGEGD